MVKFWKDDFRTVAVPGAERIFFGELCEGKYRRTEWFPREGKSLAEIFSAARAAGFGKKMALAAPFPAIRLEYLRYPSMKEEELAELMSWEADRIFRTEAALSYDYHVLSRSPEGYEVLACACKTETLLPWTEAAGEAGVRLTRIFPAVVLQEGRKAATFLAGGEDARLFLWDGNRLASTRTIHRGEAEDVLENADGGDFFFFPREDCGEAAFAEWTGLSGKEEAEAARRAADLRMGTLAEQGIALNLSGEADRETPFLSKETMPLRCLELAAVLLFILCLGLGFSWQTARETLSAEEARAASLAETKSAKEERERAGVLWRDTMAEAKTFYNRKRFTLSDLILLSDAMPDGVTLTRIGKSGEEVVIEGGYQKTEDVYTLQKRLEEEKRSRCRLELASEEKGNRHFRFHLSDEEVSRAKK